MAEVVVVLGSARKESDTEEAVRKLCPYSKYEIVDLREFNISHYEYDHILNKNDEFLKVVTKLTESNVIVFATPVYWYAMSGRLKVFLDRFTELLSTYKTMGKGLAGKKTMLIVCGSDEKLPDGFEVPFERTSHYFGMEFLGTRYLCTKMPSGNTRFETFPV